MASQSNKKREVLLGKHLTDGNLQGFVDELQYWLGELEKGIANFEEEHISLKSKRDSADTLNTALTARVEQRVKDWVLPRIPAWVTPDHLTFFGLFGIIVSAIGLILGFFYPAYLALVVIGLFIHWFGDCFDGAIARYRKKTRPVYGYYIDKIIDTIAIIIFAIGLGLSGFAKIEIALLFAIGYMALAIQVDLVVHLEGKCKNSFGLFGPTEIRMIGMIAAVYMYIVGTSYYNVFGHSITQYDIALLLVCFVMSVMLLVSIVRKAVEFNKRDTISWVK